MVCTREDRNSVGVWYVRDQEGVSAWEKSGGRRQEWGHKQEGVSEEEWESIEGVAALLCHVYALQESCSGHVSLDWCVCVRSVGPVNFGFLWACNPSYACNIISLVMSTT